MGKLNLNKILASSECRVQMQTPLAFQANIFAPQQKGSGLYQNVTRGHFGSTLVRFKVSGLACIKKHWHHG